MLWQDPQILQPVVWHTNLGDLVANGHGHGLISDLGEKEIHVL